MFAALAALALAGSLSPFDLRLLPLPSAIRLFAAIRFLPLGRLSRVDFASNILLFVPLGYMLSAAVDDRAAAVGSWPQVRAMSIAVAATSLLSVATEFSQVFFPSRLIAGSDILAETIGGASGVAVWGFIGRDLTRYVESILSRRERPDRFVASLALYAVVFFVFQIYPFDVTISPGDLTAKYHAGKLQFDVFANMTWPRAGSLLHMMVMLALAAPLGALAVIGWPPRLTKRHIVPALTVAIAVIVLTEIAQLFIFSRATRLDEMVALLAGAVGGTVIAFRLPARPAAPKGVAPAAVSRALVLVATAVAFVAFSWPSLSGALTTNHDFLNVRLQLFAAAPFLGRYAAAGGVMRLVADVVAAAGLGSAWGLAVRPAGGVLTPRLQTTIVAAAFFAISGALLIVQIPQRSGLPDLLYPIVTMAAGAIGFRATRAISPF